MAAASPLLALRPNPCVLQNEHKEVKVDEILGREEAEKAIKEAMVGAHNPAVDICPKCLDTNVLTCKQVCPCHTVPSWQHLGCTGGRCS